MERFRQTQPKLLISVNAVFYNNKVHSMQSKLEQIAAELSSVQKVVVIPFIKEENRSGDGLFPSAENRNREWFVALGRYISDVTTLLHCQLVNCNFFHRIPSTRFLEEFRSAKTRLQYEQVPSDHPLFIMYSSGTTGKPKCMVHSVGVSCIFFESCEENMCMHLFFSTIVYILFCRAH